MSFSNCFPCFLFPPPPLCCFFFSTYRAPPYLDPFLYLNSADMEGCCNLEVEVNGRETFMVNMETIEYYSGRFTKLFGRTKTSKKMKVIFHNFPGGSDGFELMARFCYNNAKIQITPHNIVLLNSVATFMISPNLIHQTENSLNGVSYWSWSDLIAALKQCHCQQFLPAAYMVEKIVDNLVQRLALPSIAASCTSSSDSSCHRLSTDTATNDSKKTDSSKWWFEDLVFLSIDWIEGIVKKMLLLSTEFEHCTICRFLVYYQKARFPRAEFKEKQKILESVIDLFLMLDRSSVSYKCLFQIFHLCSVLKMRNKYVTAMESLIGSRLDQANVGQLLFPSPIGDKYAYDVNLVLRIVEAFLLESNGKLCLNRLKNVGLLMDLYLEEVGPDYNLNPSKFAELVSVMPDAARDCHDRLYKSIDLYFETHCQICREERLRICSVLNCTKLSADALKNLALNSRFPSRFRAAAVAKCNKEEIHVNGFRKKVVEMANLMKSPRLLSQRNDRYFPKLCSTL